MKVITKEHITHVLSKDNPPCDRITSGERVAFETYDCFTNRFIPEGTDYYNTPKMPGNPATGPLYIEGAKEGDMLKIDILDIETGPTGIVMLGPNNGNEREFFEKRIVKRVPVRDGFAWYDNKITIPVQPMIGVIGVAPKGEGVSTVTPLDHGGNMDCTQIKKGVSLYLPVFTDGALLSMGDFHAVMGEGEIEDCGLEIEGRATMRVTAVKDFYVPWPMIDTGDKWITIASKETVDLAYQAAARQMYTFLTEKVGMKEDDAAMLMTMTGDLIICQTVNPTMTVRMEFPKRIIRDYNPGFLAV